MAARKGQGSFLRAIVVFEAKTTQEALDVQVQLVQVQVSSSGWLGPVWSSGGFYRTVSLTFFLSVVAARTAQLTSIDVAGLAPFADFKRLLCQLLPLLGE